MKDQGGVLFRLLSVACLLSYLPASAQKPFCLLTLSPFQLQTRVAQQDQEMIKARGYGSINPKAADRAKAYLKARDVAYAQAVSNLLVKLQGVQVKHRLQVQDYEVLQQGAQLEVEGTLQGVEVLSERMVLLHGAPAVEVTVGIRLPKPVPAEGAVQPAVSKPVKPSLLKQPETLSLPSEQGYTSVIIDCRDWPFRPSIGPRILRPDGSEVWGTVEVDPDFAIQEGIAVFTRSLEEAKAHPRAGRNPLILQAIGVSGPAWNDVILSEEDVRLLKVADSVSGFLKAFRVIFVTQ